MDVGNSKPTNDDTDIQASEAPLSLRPNQPAETKVKVALRVRPFIHKEIMDNEQKCTQCYLETGQVLIGKDKTFSFDYVFDADSRQDEVYEHCAKELVPSCLAGYNATILAYGQTGSGKTFTMGSNTTYETDPKDSGIIPRVMKELFNEIEKRKTKSEFILRVSFLEIYNEEIQDLLDTTASRFRFNPSYNKNPIAIREEKDGSISVYGAKEEKVTSYEEMSAYLEKGSLQRSTASTLMNETSSRSHGIFTISIEQHQIDDLYKETQKKATKTKDKEKTADTSFTSAKFHFVDLAGSERLKKTGASGAILREGININRGLLALGNVISALTDLSGKISHVPYRESKLTRILQDSLGGNSRTVMIACISPAESNFDESLNTLKYASRARNIKNKPIVNTDPQSTLISQLKQQVFELQRQLLSYKKILSTDLKDHYSGDPQVLQSLLSGNTAFAAIGASDETEVLKEEVKNLKIKLVQHEKELTLINNELHQTKNTLNQSEISNFSVQKERDMLKLLAEKYRKTLEENNLFTAQEEDSDLVDLEKETLVEEYTRTIDKLKHDLKDKEQLSHEVNKEYESLLQSSQRDQELLLEKTKMIQALKAQLRRQELQMGKSDKFLGANPNTAADEELLMKAVAAGAGSQGEIRDDFEDNEEDKLEKEYDINAQRHKKEMLLVDGNLNEKEELLKSMTQNQILLEKSLMEGMQNKYYQKAMLLEQEKKALEKQINEAMSNKAAGAVVDNEKTKVITTYKQKISELENKMKDFRKKEREQQSMMKLVESQRTKIVHLDDEIKKIKTQKMQLHKKVREETEKFEKWKASRQKELLEAKKNNVEKDMMISKLRTEKKKQELVYKKKADEMLAKYMSKELLFQIQSESGKTPMAPTPSSRKKKTISFQSDESGFFGVDDSQMAASATEEDAKQLIDYCTERLLENLRVSYRVEKEEESLRKTEEELDQERNKYAELMLKRDRIELERRGSMSDLDFEQALETKLQEFDLEMNEVYTHIETLEAKLDFQLAKINEYTDNLSRKPSVSPEQLLLHNDKIIKNPNNLKIVLRCLFGKHIGANLEIVKLQEKNSQQVVDMIEMRKRIEDAEQKARFNELQYEISLTKLTKEYEKSQQLLLVKEQTFDEDMELLDAMGPGQADSTPFNLQSAQSLEIGDAANLDVITPSERKADLVESPTKKSGGMMFTKGKIPGESLADQNKRLEKMVTEFTRKQTSNEKVIADLKKRCEVLQMKYDQLKRPNMKERAPNLKALAAMDERQNANERSQFSTNVSMNQSSLNLSTLNNTARKGDDGDATTRSKTQIEGGKQKGLASLASLREKRKEEKSKQNLATPSNKSAASGAGNEEAKMDRQRTLSNIDPKSQNPPDTRNRKHTVPLSKVKSTGPSSETDLALKKKTSHSESIETGDSGLENELAKEPLEDVIEESVNWKCHATMKPAHNSPIYCVSSLGNMLYSSGYKTFGVWSLDTITCISEIMAHSSYIKSIAIWPEKNLLATACDKTISLWDLVNLQNIGTLKGHKDEIKTLTVCNDLLLSGGKGSSTNGSLFVWDLRSFNPLEEKERDQEISSMVTHNGVLYYGNQNNQIRSLKLSNMEPLVPFEPSHQDSITSLSVLNNQLVSSSKDSTMKLWDLNHYILNMRHSWAAPKDYISATESSIGGDALYTGSKGGLIRIWNVEEGKLNCMDTITGHKQSVNSICKLYDEHETMFATASGDKNIKVWKPVSDDDDIMQKTENLTRTKSPSVKK